MKQKKKYKKLNKDAKKYIITALIFIFIIIILSLILNYLENKSSKNTNISDYSNIQEILEKFGCTYIKQTKSKDKNYELDIYLKFKYNTFEENESQERYYNILIGNIGRFLNENFRLIDESRNLNIEVVKVEDSYGYIINGDSDYFINQSSKVLLKNYTQEEITTLQINSPIISNLVNSNWNYNNIDFGTKDSKFEEYEIYFDEGVEVRKISQKIYNIIFNTKYSKNVINNIVPGTSFEEIISKLGTPTYGTSESKIIGYKGNDFYVFFSEDEISIYRNEEIDTKEFEELVEKYTNQQIELKEFINELTYLWDDYSEYTYSEDYIKLVYPTKGVQIFKSDNNSKNIQIYNNYSNIEGIQKLINESKIKGRLDENLVYTVEIDRKAKKNDLLYLCDLQAENRPITRKSNLYSYYISQNKINFISKDVNRPNTTLLDNINSSFWYTDTLFIYSIKGKGIYLYDLNTYTKSTLLNGNENYTFEKYENNILTYDENKTIEISNI